MQTKNINSNIALAIVHPFQVFNGYAPSKLSGKILLRVEASGEAYYVNPSDIEDISKGIALCEERAPSSLEERLSWTANFSWEKAASQTADVFKEVA